MNFEKKEAFMISQASLDMKGMISDNTLGQDLIFWEKIAIENKDNFSSNLAFFIIIMI